MTDEMRQVLEASGKTGQSTARLPRRTSSFRRFAPEQEARDALIQRDLKGTSCCPADYMATGASMSIRRRPSASRVAIHAMRSAILLRGGCCRTDRAGVAARIVDPLKRRSASRSAARANCGMAAQAASFVRLAVPLLFMVLFLLSVLMTSGYLMQGTAIEKENKVVEVLLASANPDEILAGKLLGLGAAGLLQIAVWLLMMLSTGLGIVPLLVASPVDMPWRAVALAIPFFILAFLFFGGLMLGTGSLGSNMREAQQLAMIWSLTAALPMMLMSVLIGAARRVARVLTWVPFTAGPIIVLRASTDADLAGVVGMSAADRAAGCHLAGIRLGAPAVSDRAPQRRGETQPARDHAQAGTAG